MRDLKTPAIIFLAATVGITYLYRDDSFEWTQETGASIHRKTITEEETKAGIFGKTISIRDAEENSTILSFFLRSVREEQEKDGKSYKVVCVTETKGWRIPFTNAAIASSGSACSVGDFAAEALLRMNMPAYAFEY